MDDTDSSLHFSEDDIRQQLDLLGYHNIPASQLRQFAQDLEQLIRQDAERLKSSRFWVSDSDVSADDLRIGLPVQSHQLDQGSTAANRRPASAPSSSRRKSPKKKSQSTGGPGRTIKPPHQARHTQPFSYKYNDTSTAELHDSDVMVIPGRGGQERRRSSEKPAMKRKVVRKMNGQVHIFDESIADSEPGDQHDMTDRMSRLALGRDDQGNITEDADSTLTETDASSLMGVVYTGRRPQSSSELYSHRPAGDENTVYKPHLPRSYIRPDTAKPKAKHDERTDPVTRHQMYRAEWNSHRAPGEKSRKDLRWNIREQMMYKDMTYPQRTSRVHSANNYIVPTDKKRQALRWAVRTSLAHKQMPASTFYHPP